MIVRLTKSEGRRLGRADRRLHGQFTSLSWWGRGARASTRPSVESNSAQHESTLAVGFSLPRRLGTAPQRNRLRRQLRAAVRVSTSAELSSGVAIIHGHDVAVGAKSRALHDEIEHMFATLGPSGEFGDHV